MTRRIAPTFEDYRDTYETIRLERSDDGVLEATIHGNGGPSHLDVHGARRADLLLREGLVRPG